MPTRHGRGAPLGTVLALPVALVLLLLVAFLVLAPPDADGTRREPASFDPSPPAVQDLGEPAPATTIEPR